MCVDEASPDLDRSMEELVRCSAAVAAVPAGVTDARLLLRRANAAWAVRDVETVLADLDRAIAAGSDLPAHVLAGAHHRRCVGRMQAGRLEEAEADATTALSLYSRAGTLAARCIVRFFRGDLSGAVADAGEALALDPGQWEARAFRGRARLKAGDAEGAVADLAATIESGQCAKYVSELLVERARARLLLGDAARAEADCTAAVDRDHHEQVHWPFLVRSRSARAHLVYLVRAEARLALGSLPRALADCFYAADIRPEDPAVYELRARVHRATANLTEAVRDLTRAEWLRLTRATTDEPTTAAALALADA